MGMYNLGNTCFQSAVLQCLIACDPVQTFFLRSILHHHVACQEFRSAQSKGRKTTSSSDKSSENADKADVCLACELDKLILQYYGNSKGVNALAAVSGEAPKPNANTLGEPLVTANILTSAWRCGGMNHLAGYDQRDAHEFLHGFLENLSKHDLSYRRNVELAVGLTNHPLIPPIEEKGPVYRGMY